MIVLILVGIVLLVLGRGGGGRLIAWGGLLGMALTRLNLRFNPLLLPRLDPLLHRLFNALLHLRRRALGLHRLFNPRFRLHGLQPLLELLLFLFLLNHRA